jgi:hypothetical protein
MHTSGNSILVWKIGSLNEIKTCLDGLQLNGIFKYVGLVEHGIQRHLKPIFLVLNLSS